MKVLIVDDSTYIRNSLRFLLEENNYEVVGEAKDGKEAIDLAALLNPDIITLDQILPDITGIEVLKTLREKKHQSFVVMISAVGQESLKSDASELGINHYMIKPIDQQVLIEVLKRAKSD